MRLPLPAPVSASDRRAIVDKSDARLLRIIRDYASFDGHGQEMGRDADGPEVNRRRTAVSAMVARYGEAAADKLPRRRNVKSDLIWIRSAELQTISSEKPFDFSWSTNPMSTPEVLDALAIERASRAGESARAIEAEPGRAYDARGDLVTAHLNLEDGDLRGAILADALLQLRAKRRTTEDQGRIGSIGVVTAFEQRLACASLPKGADLAARRERGLLRFVVAQQCGGSVNALYDARNTVAILPDYLGDDIFASNIGEAPGLDVPLYHAIHQRYSGNTPRAVHYYLTERAFTGGEPSDRIDVLKLLVEAGSPATLADAKVILEQLEERYHLAFPDALAARTHDALRAPIIRYLRSHTELPAIARELEDRDIIKTHALLLSLHNSLSNARPTAAELELDLPYAGRAEPSVAALIHTMRHGELPAQVEAVGAARSALAKEIARNCDGFERQMLMRLDRKIELVSAEILGTAQGQVGSDDASLPLCLLAVRSALRGVLASDFDAMRGRVKTAPTEDLSSLLSEIDEKFAAGAVKPDEARSLLGRVFASATEVADAFSIYLRRREASIHFSGIDVELHPYAIDGIVKESALHYLLELASRGLGGSNWAEGARSLSSVGPRVYRRMLVAHDVEKMKRWKPTSDDLLVIESAREKRLPLGGGLILDSLDAGPGYSHASVFAKGHGISAIALPDLARRYSPMLRDFPDGEIYVDDRPASFTILPLSQAIADGLVARDGVDALRPGSNRTFSWFDVKEDGSRQLLKRDELRPFADRDTKEVELLVPDLSDRLGIGGPISFEDLAALPLDRARQLAGEKGTVLARLSTNERLQELGVKIPGGAVIPPFVVSGLLREAGILEKWSDAAKSADPKDAARFQARVRRALSEVLLRDGRPTPEGKKLLAALERVPALKGRVPWIVRSSFTGEDRPNKSAAGQYDSFPNVLSAKQRLEAIAGVIASAWNEEAVKANREMGVDATLVWPAIVIQPCLDAEKSGVAFSRGPSGAFGVIGYQAKRGFGGGVGGGAAEAGIVDRRQASKSKLLTERQQRTLYEAVQEIEREFDRSIEPGAHHAVDVEWVIERGVLNIVQARTIVGI